MKQPTLSIDLMGVLMILHITHSKVLKMTTDSAQDQEDDVTLIASSNGYHFKLQSPITYTMEDLVVTLSVLLILFIMIIIWYGVARVIIYLAYHKKEKKLDNFYDIEDQGFMQVDL